MTPTFGRIEIKLADKASLSNAADKLEVAAQKLRKLSNSKATATDETLVLAHNVIKEASQALRGCKE